MVNANDYNGSPGACAWDQDQLEPEPHEPDDPSWQQLAYWIDVWLVDTSPYCPLHADVLEPCVVCEVMDAAFTWRWQQRVMAARGGTQ